MRISRNFFILLVEMIKGNLQGKATKTSKGLSLWIHFSEKGSKMLMEDIEECSSKKLDGRLKSSFVEYGRYASLEKRRNRNSIPFKVWDVEKKPQLIAILEGGLNSEGWKL